MGDLAGLIERLEKLAGPDREVDVYLHALAVGGRIHSVSDGETIIERPIDGFWIRNVLPIKSRKIAAYTASLDAAIALVGKVLPGWARGFDAGPKSCIAFVDPHDYADRMFGARHVATASTPAIAMCLALLRAMQKEEQ